MTWHWRRRRPEATTPAEHEETRMITTDEVMRAEVAAKEAALDLQSARARREEVDETFQALRAINRENGFADLIRDAFGS